MDKKKYLKDSSKCPYCDSPEITGGRSNYSGDTMWRTISCNNCSKRWDEVYDLVNVEEIDVSNWEKDLPSDALIYTIY